jgi:transcriptional regulator with XRE-family HTH domain
MGRPLRVSTPTTKAFAERLSDLVQAKKNQGLSHDEISREIGVSSGVLSEWMSDNKTASIENLAKLSRYFSVTSDYLLGLSEAKTADKDVQIACKTTGLSADAIESLRFDHSQSKRRDIFAFEDFLIKESYVSFWAVQMRNSVKNIVEVNSLQSKLGSDIVTDETNFHRWQAMRSFEKSFNKAVEEFTHLYSEDLKIADTNAYLVARKKEFEKYLKRIEELQSSQK